VARVDVAASMWRGGHRHVVFDVAGVEVTVVCGVWLHNVVDVMDSGCGGVDVAWSTGRGHECPHPST